MLASLLFLKYATATKVCIVKWTCLTLKKLQPLEIMISPGHWGHRVSRWVAAAHSSLGPYVLVCPRASHVLLVNVQQPAFGRERTLIRSVRQFWWYKYFYHGLSQSANLHIFWKSNNWLLQAGTSTLWYKHILPRSQHTTVQCPTLPPNVVTWIKVTPASHTTLSSCAL